MSQLRGAECPPPGDIARLSELLENSDKRHQMIKNMSSCCFQFFLFVACCVLASASEEGARTSRRNTCGVAQPEDPELVAAVKRHILGLLQLRERPNITHPVPKAAMVTALRKLHAGRLREDGGMEIPHLDGHAMSAREAEESSEVISFAERGV